MKYEPFKIEEEIYQFWNKNNIPEKVYKGREKNNKFRFLEGPPTLNNEPHVGHFRGRAIKDIIMKYKLLKGYNIWHQAGWDCQGLPVELEVEKKLNTNTKSDIEKYGVENFVNECKNFVNNYKTIWENLCSKLGMWLDWKNAYMTMKDEHIEFVWYTIKKAYERGMLVKKLRTVPWCPRCETSLSQHEVAQGYTESTDPSIYFRVKLKSEDKYLLVWTTTPWTLVANVAMTANPDIEYAEVKAGLNTYIFASQLVENVAKELGWEHYEIIRTFSGKELEDKTYVPLLEDEIPKQKEFGKKNICKVVLSDLPTLEKGTGIVHIAPGCGPEDYDLGLKLKLPIFSPVDEAGKYTEEVGKYKGMYVFDANDAITEELKDKGIIIKAGKIKHEYPFCWRCNTKLIFRGSGEWFFTVDPIKHKLLSENEKIKWIPDWAGKRFNDWLENARDWGISRKRYWGSPLPIWICDKCGKIEVIGSKEELKKVTKKLPKELHRPWVDEITWKCSGKGDNKCEGMMIRTPEVADCWLDSGVAPGASLGFLQNEKDFWEWFPSDLITEGTDQTRGWYYTLLFSNVITFDQTPYLTVLNQGFVLDEEGKKMSKSKGNAIWARDIINNIGADIFRFYITWKTDPWESINFSKKENDMILRMLNTLWNMKELLLENMELYGLSFKDLDLNKFGLEKEDVWIISCLNSALKEVTYAMDKYDLNKSAKIIYDLILNKTSRDYIQMVRERINGSKEDAITVLATLYYLLKNLNYMIAPFTPYISEKIGMDLELKEKSIFMGKWPEIEETKINLNIEKHMSNVIDIISSTLSLRDKAKIGTRWPLQKLIIFTEKDDIASAADSLRELIMKQCNLKEISIVTEKPNWVTPKIKFNYKTLNEKFKEKVPKIVSKLIEISPNSIQYNLNKNNKVTINVEGEDYDILKEDLIIEENLPENIIGAYDSDFNLYLNITLTKQLYEEGFSREIVRKIQSMRKDNGLKKGQKAKIFIASDVETKNIIEKYKKDIENRTGCEIIIQNVVPESEKISIKNKEISLKMEK